MPETIKITGINLSDSTLLLDNNSHPHHLYGKGVTVVWQITDPSIDKIDAIEEKSGSENIWQQFPSRQSNGMWKGVIKKNAKDCDVWAYSIKWHAKASTKQYIFDPIISIKPTTSMNLLFWLLPLIFGGLFVYQTIRLSSLRRELNRVRNNR